jgi:hypothetical protein
MVVFQVVRATRKKPGIRVAPSRLHLRFDFHMKKIVRPNIGGHFKLKNAQTPRQCLSYQSCFVGHTDPGLEPGDLRRMRNFQTHPAGFTLLSPPYNHDTASGAELN